MDLNVLCLKLCFNLKKENVNKFCFDVVWKVVKTLFVRKVEVIYML